jgi:hypothetical protein
MSQMRITLAGRIDTPISKAALKLSCSIRHSKRPGECLGAFASGWRIGRTVRVDLSEETHHWPSFSL